MKTSRTLRHVVMAVALLVAFLAQATWVLAGTTGSLSGQVSDETGAPVAGAAVKVASASQTATATTDGSGHFSFISLAPDTYVVTVTKQGYNPNSYPGVTVFADQSQTLALRLPKGLRQIAHVAATAAGSLVKSGTTADVYSVNSATQQTVMGSGGGYNLDSAYSAIYSQPGVTSQIGNYGFGQVYYIRGSSYSQVGYEYDGVPVNRAFDNYNANSLSSLGSQETEVYTGGSPASGTSATLAGYINQVIKTGTFPGYAQGNFGLGTPGFYHKAGVEAGGATPDRLFSWYVGIQGSDQSYRTIDNNDGAGIANDGTSQYGIFSSFSNSISGAFTPYFNGPWSTCGGANNNGTGAIPKGALQNTYFGIAIPTCNAYGPWNASGFLGLPLDTQDRENVMNFHFGIPHKNDAGRDDVQALFYNFSYHQEFGGNIDNQGGLATLNSNLPDWGGPNGIGQIFGIGANYPGEFGPYSNLCAYQLAAVGGACGTGASTLQYFDTRIFNPGTQFGQNAANVGSTRYLSPSQGSYAPGTTIATNNADTTYNDASIIKLQYQKNFGSSAYVRIMGYSSYSDWLQSNANVAGEGFTGYGYGTTGEDYPAPDYELDTHTRGVQLQASDQINAQNLLSLTGNYTTASVVRWNNQYYSAPGTVTNLIGKNGECYNYSDGSKSNCLLTNAQGQNVTGGGYANPTQGWAQNNACANLPGTPACAAGAQFQVTVPQGYGTLNTVVPQFSALALTDEWRPGDKWDINAGVRFESYVYDLANTVNPEFNFWFNQAANAYCYDPKTGQPILQTIHPGAAPGSLGPQILPNLGAGETAGLCYNSNGTPYISPSGIQARHPNGKNGSELYTDQGADGFSHPEWSPRVGGTYSFDPNDVLRFNYGRFTQPTQTAYEQYSNASGLGAAKFDYTYFWGLGFNTPTHDNPVQVSNNYDLSYEKHFANTDISMKLSPFYRWTTNQLVTISLGGNFASAINAATQKTSGVELALQKGDPSRNGLSGQLSYTYTDAKIKYSTLANGSNGIDVINNYISGFNKLTKAGGGSPWYCTNGAGPNGTNGPSANGQCGPGQNPIANPYYNEHAQGLLDRNGWYDTYPNEPPQATPDEGLSAISPNVFAGFLNYKHDKFTATVNAILNEGTSYGSPLSVIGLDPRTCNLNQSGVAGVNPKYFGYADFQSCGPSAFVSSGNLAIPDPQTGTFDNVGQFREPWQLNMGLQFGYDVTPRIHLTATLANVLNTCFGGSAESWTAKYNPNNIVCAYAGNGQTYIGNQPGAGFFYGASGHDPANGTAGYPGVFNSQYQPLFGALPFQVYFNAQIRL
jgi:hypothetical protein